MKFTVTVLLGRPSVQTRLHHPDSLPPLNLHPISFCLLNVFLIYHKAQKKKVSDATVCKYWWVLQNIHIWNEYRTTLEKWKVKLVMPALLVRSLRLTTNCSDRCFSFSQCSSVIGRSWNHFHRRQTDRPLSNKDVNSEPFETQRSCSETGSSLPRSVNGREDALCMSYVFQVSDGKCAAVCCQLKKKSRVSGWWMACSKVQDILKHRLSAAAVPLWTLLALRYARPLYPEATCLRVSYGFIFWSIYGFMVVRWSWRN